MPIAALDMVALTTPPHWAAYHDIRRAVLFEGRGRLGVYDERHPDDRASANHPFLLMADGVAVAAVRVDLGVEPGAAVFRRLAVRAPLQGHGYGRALMSRAEQFAERRGCRLLVAYVAPDAVEFWAKLGYRVASKQTPGTDPRMEKPIQHSESLMKNPTYPAAVVASEAPPRAKPSNYPEPFASQVAGRGKHPLGDLFGLSNFGVNLTRLAPGAISALRHAHTKQDEFVYVLQGHPTLHTDEGRTRLSPGMCAGFKAGTGNGHQLVNETEAEVVYLEMGDRTPGDEGTFPDDDLKASLVDGKWKFMHKDGTPY